jgi:hypothetical protein
MPPRLSATRSRLGDILIYDRGDADAADPKPIALHLDTHRRDFAIAQSWLPTDADADGGVQLTEWTWSNGPGGAGTTIETPASRQQGASDFAVNGWLRRVGVAQPAGKLTELELPVGAAAVVSDNVGFLRGILFEGHLWITTNGRYAVRVTNASGADGLTEKDFGASASTSGIAIFNGAGTARLYIGDPANGIWELDPATGLWTEGEAGTERIWLETTHWMLGDALASGGLVGTAGVPAHRLIATDADGTGFYHVAGDPQVAANWSDLTTVGTGGTQYPIVSTVTTNHEVFFPTGLGVHGVNGLGYSPNLTKWVEQIAWPQNGTEAVYWAGLIWFTTRQGLVAFAPNGDRLDLARTLQFGARSGMSEIYGFIQALAPCEDGLYVGTFNNVTGDSYVGCLLLDESGGFRWSMAEAYLPNVAVTYIQQAADTSGNPHLFIGARTSGGSMKLYVQDLPVSGDPEADYTSGATVFRSATSWSVQLSRFDGERAVRKTARRFRMQADQVGEDFAANQIEFEVSNDGGDFVVQGTARGTSVNYSQWNAQPQANTAQATSMQVRLDVTNDEDVPVIIRSASVLYSSHPELSRVIRAPILIGEGIDNDPRLTLQRLERAQRAGPLVIDDFFGRRIEGTISVDQETVVLEAERNGYSVHATITILVTRQASRFSAGDTFDGGYTFS